ncbi:MAG: DUF2726 domain-containing protein [Opitutaceae bacterium]|nr:DUF2726 domain-containing protein [Opitutaceae bacterium]
MKFLILLVILVGAAAFFLALMKVRGSGEGGEDGSSADYERLGSVLSPAERKYLGVMAPLLPQGVGVLVKVRLAEVFVPRRGLEAARRRAAGQRLRGESVDFLLVRAEDFSPLAGMAFHEEARRPESREARSYFVENTFVRNGLPYLTVAAQEAYDGDDLRDRLASLLGRQRPRA